MCASGVAGYAAVNAQVRAMYSNMLSTESWEKLYEANDFNNLIMILKNTVYAPYLTSLEGKDLTPRRTVFEIKKHLANAYTTLLAPGSQTHPSGYNPIVPIV